MTASQADRGAPVAVAVVSDSRLAAEALATALTIRGVAAAGRQLTDPPPEAAGCWLVVLTRPDGREGSEELAPVRQLLQTAGPVRRVHVLAAGGEAARTRLGETLDVAVRSTALEMDGLVGLLDGRPPVSEDRPRATAGNGARHLAPEAGLVRELTPREREVLRELVGGGTQADVADRLGLAAGTVRTHVQSIRAKLGVSSTIEAVAVARRAGLRPPQRRGGTVLDEALA